MKILLWIGNESNQRALASKLHAVIPIIGIVKESRKRKTRLTAKLIVEKIIERLFLSVIANAWFGMKAYYNSRYPNYPPVAYLDVENINADDAFEFSKKLNPDLIIVSGTRLIKQKMLGLKPSIGIINLHTGLSPYIKGGPNCTNWCLSTKQFHLIGNTVMWIDEGIDTGNILATEFTDLSGGENLNEIHVKVMEHAHSLCVRAVSAIEKGSRTSVPQSEIAGGVTYFTKDWTLKRKVDLVRRYRLLKEFVASGEIEVRRREVKTIGV